jgi:nicotinamidase-related amidase
MLNLSDAVLIVVDVQGKLARVVENSDNVIGQIQKLVKGMLALEIPIIMTSQIPEKLGGTIEEIAALLPDHEQISRTSFSVFRSIEMLNRLAELKKKQIILCGFETHICLYQSALDLMNSDYEVYLVVDGTSSRKGADKDTSLIRVGSEGGKLTTVEMTLFEIMRDARHPAFKAVARIIK